MQSTNKSECKKESCSIFHRCYFLQYTCFFKINLCLQKNNYKPKKNSTVCIYWRLLVANSINFSFPDYSIIIYSSQNKSVRRWWLMTEYYNTFFKEKTLPLLFSHSLSYLLSKETRSVFFQRLENLHLLFTIKVKVT